MTKRPQDVIGTHFFSPANVMRLLEVVRGAKTAKDVLATTMKLGKTIKKVPVVSGVCDGFIGNRMMEKYGQQSLFLLDEGCYAAAGGRRGLQVGHGDGAARDGRHGGPGHRLGDPQAPLRRAAELRLLEGRRQGLPNSGRYGQKTGKGWYQLRTGRDRKPIPDPEVEQIIAELQEGKQHQDRAQISDEEIVERLIYALVNEAAYILEEGIALRASDIDMVYLTGYGFPPYRGGPMFYADTVGLTNVLASIEKFQARATRARCGSPRPLLVKLANEGKNIQ